MFIAEKALSTITIATSKINAKVTNGYETSSFIFLIITKWDPMVLYIRIVVGGEVY